MGFFDWLLGAKGNHPADEALESAILQVMAGTDPRLKALSGARERLAPAVEHALAYARRISHQQPPCTDMRPANWAASPVLRALFARPKDIANLLGRSPDLREFLAVGRKRCGPEIFCIVAATPETHTTLGVAMEGDMLRRDVEQRRMSFRDARLLGFSPHPAALQQRIREMVLEALVQGALAKVTEARAQALALEAEHQLLQHRQHLMGQSRAGFNSLHGDGDHHQDLLHLNEKLAENEAALASIKSESGWLETTLERVVAHLAAAEESLPIHPTVLWLNAMNVVSDPQAPDACPIPLMEIIHPQRLAFPARIHCDDVVPAHLDIDAALRLL